MKHILHYTVLLFLFLAFAPQLLQSMPAAVPEETASFSAETRTLSAGARIAPSSECVMPAVVQMTECSCRVVNPFNRYETHSSLYKQILFQTEPCSSLYLSCPEPYRFQQVLATRHREGFYLFSLRKLVL